MTSLKDLILAFCMWCNESYVGHTIHDSVWLFPFVEIFHLLALGVLGGCMLVLNMRLMGIGFRTDSVSDLARDLRPWIIGSLGVMLFSTEAVKMYGNWGFQVKMLFLLLSIVFTFTVHRRVTSHDDAAAGVRWTTALLSLAMWAMVGLGGRSLGYITTAASAVKP